MRSRNFRFTYDEGLLSSYFRMEHLKLFSKRNKIKKNDKKNVKRFAFDIFETSLHDPIIHMSKMSSECWKILQFENSLIKLSNGVSVFSSPLKSNSFKKHF